MHRKVIEIEPKLGDVLDELRRRPILQIDVEDLLPEPLFLLPKRRSLPEIEVDQEHSSAEEREVGGQAQGERRFSFLRHTRADQKRLRCAGGLGELQRGSRRPYGLGVW